MAQKQKWGRLIECGESVDVLRQLIDEDSLDLSVRRQCELLGLSRSTWFYEAAAETEANLCLMRRSGEQYLETPFYGSRRMTVWLLHAGHAVNRKRVQRLMQWRRSPRSRVCLWPPRNTANSRTCCGVCR